MIRKKFQTENFDCWTARVGEVVIGNETIPVYEINVSIKENKIEKVIPDYWEFTDSSYEQDFIDVVRELLDETQKEETVSLPFIYSDINRYSFDNTRNGDDNPLIGFLQVWRDGPDGGEWLTWMESPAVADKREKDKAFRTMFEKWALAKFLQLVFGNRSLPFALPHYGTKDTDKTIRLYSSYRGFGNGLMDVGKMTAYSYYHKVSGHHHNLYAIWDNERNEFLFEHNRTLTEEELEQLHKDLTEKVNKIGFSN